MKKSEKKKHGVHIQNKVLTPRHPSGLTQHHGRGAQSAKQQLSWYIYNPWTHHPQRPTATKQEDESLILPVR